MLERIVLNKMTEIRATRPTRTDQEKLGQTRADPGQTRYTLFFELVCCQLTSVYAITKINKILECIILKSKCPHGLSHAGKRVVLN